MLPHDLAKRGALWSRQSQNLVQRKAAAGAVLSEARAGHRPGKKLNHLIIPSSEVEGPEEAIVANEENVRIFF
jgi:hypothetical protein